MGMRDVYDQREFEEIILEYLDMHAIICGSCFRDLHFIQSMCV